MTNIAAARRAPRACALVSLVVFGLGASCQPTADSSEEPAGTGGTTVDPGRASGGAGGAPGLGAAGAGGTGGIGSGGAGGGVAAGGTGGDEVVSGTGGAPTNGPGDAGAGDASSPDAATPGAPSAGCGRMNAGGTFMITAGNATTPYRVVLPTTYDANKRYPVIFYLHGRGNGIEGQGNLNRDVAAANLGIVVYPKSFGGSGWEVPGRDKPDENLALIRALIKHLGEQYCVDSKKIIMTGFSSGCWFSSRLACTMKDELAGVVAAACGLDPMGRCPDRKPLTYIIGRGDGAFGGAPAAAEFYRTRNACMMTSKPSATAPCQLYDGCGAGSPTTYCAHPGGHQWPAFASKAVLEMLEKL